MISRNLIYKLSGVYARIGYSFGQKSIGYYQSCHKYFQINNKHFYSSSNADDHDSEAPIHEPWYLRHEGYREVKKDIEDNVLTLNNVRTDVDLDVYPLLKQMLKCSTEDFGLFDIKVYDWNALLDRQNIPDCGAHAADIVVIMTAKSSRHLHAATVSLRKFCKKELNHVPDVYGIDEVRSAKRTVQKNRRRITRKALKHTYMPTEDYDELDWLIFRPSSEILKTPPIIFHIFTEEAQEFYDIENFWSQESDSFNMSSEFAKTILGAHDLQKDEPVKSILDHSKDDQFIKKNVGPKIHKRNFSLSTLYFFDAKQPSYQQLDALSLQSSTLPFFEFLDENKDTYDTLSPDEFREFLSKVRDTTEDTPEILSICRSIFVKGQYERAKVLARANPKLIKEKFVIWSHIAAAQKLVNLTSSKISNEEDSSIETSLVKLEESFKEYMSESKEKSDVKYWLSYFQFYLYCNQCLPHIYSPAIFHTILEDLLFTTFEMPDELFLKIIQMCSYLRYSNSNIKEQNLLIDESIKSRFSIIYTLQKKLTGSGDSKYTKDLLLSLYRSCSPEFLNFKRMVANYSEELAKPLIKYGPNLKKEKLEDLIEQHKVQWSPEMICIAMMISAFEHDHLNLFYYFRMLRVLNNYCLTSVDWQLFFLLLAKMRSRTASLSTLDHFYDYLISDVERCVITDSLKEIIKWHMLFIDPYGRTGLCRRICNDLRLNEDIFQPYDENNAAEDILSEQKQILNRLEIDEVVRNRLEFLNKEGDLVIGARPSPDWIDFEAIDPSTLHKLAPDSENLEPKPLSLHITDKIQMTGQGYSSKGKLPPEFKKLENIELRKKKYGRSLFPVASIWQKEEDNSSQSNHEDPCALHYYVDQFFRCVTATQQIQTLYRFGEWTNCGKAWRDLRWCIGTRAMRTEDANMALRTRRIHWMETMKSGPNSEDVWNIRKNTPAEADWINHE